jgi:formylglycine-generating enzyme required for sulfatase activity
VKLSPHILGAVACSVLGACASAPRPIEEPAAPAAEVDAYEILRVAPDPQVIPDPALRRRIAATGHPWSVRHRKSGIELVLVPPGEFERGASEGDAAAQDDERPRQHVAFERGFYIGRCEVTQGQWLRVHPRNPSSFRGAENLPVEGVSWTDLHGESGFLARASGGLRLPSEAEWEYAGRAGSQGPRHGALDAILWCDKNSGDRTHPVGEKQPNALGLHDVLGNVAEWCEEPYAFSPGRSAPRSKTQRVLRGGSWAAVGEGCRISNRFPEWEGARASHHGLRVVADLESVHGGGLRVVEAEPAPTAEPETEPISSEDPRLPWALVLDVEPDPLVITSVEWRKRIAATGWPWRVRHVASGVEMVLIPPGEYRRGASQGDSDAALDEKPAHRVHITAPFYLGRYEVTQEEWQRVMGANPARFAHPKQPVERISWLDARGAEGFLVRAGGGLRLPSEGEWEYAARAGNVNPLYGPVDEIAWHEGNCHDSTQPVGLRRANDLGLHDMLGNVWEWCEDWYSDIDYLRHTSGVSNPTGPTQGRMRVLRGGSWYFQASHCRASIRVAVRPSNRAGAFGLRVALTP